MVIYVHIPFCIRKCYYCDFLSGTYNEEKKSAYVISLLNEIEYYGKKYGKSGRDERINSVFFGGGTPSVLDGDVLCEILLKIKKEFSLEHTAEITVECNPGTVDRDKLSKYKEAGVNRLSIGLQSADDKELERIGRIHSYKQFLDTYDVARQLGFENINVDLMSALPGQTMESYKGTIKKILQLKPEHISAYSLILEEGTCLYDTVNRQLEQGVDTGLPDEDTEREMYYLTGRMLKEAGYNRYEISNYAKSGYECRHNTAYWRHEDYIGMGIGAASCVDDVRTKNIENIDKYIEIFNNIEDVRKNGALDNDETNHLTREDKMAEFMFLGLRMTEGISKVDFLKCFECDYDTIYGGVTKRLIEQGLLKENEKSQQISLTELGLDVSNSVMSEFLL